MNNKALIVFATVLLPAILKAQTNNIPCEKYPFIKEDYSPSKPFYHIYRVADFEVADLNEIPNATKEKVFDLMVSDISCIAPVYDHNPVTDCGDFPVKALNVNLGYILTKIDRSAYKVTNYTTPDHRLANGKVTRHIIQVGRKIYVRTTGVGNNQNKYWKLANDALPDLVWLRPNYKLYAKVQEYFHSEPMRDALPEPEGQLQLGVTKLFTAIKTKLSNAQKEDIFKQLSIQLAEDNKSFYSIYENGSKSDEAFLVSVYPVDLNNDGIEEIFVDYGNCETSGRSCSQLSIFTLGKDGKYLMTYDNEGGAAVVKSNGAVPYILVAGAGLTRPLLKWDGEKFKYFKDVDFSENSSLKFIDVAIYSKRYQTTIF